MNQIGGVAVATVKDKVAVSAGLLTHASAAQLFGGWVAEHFLVVQVTISNQSRDQQFVLHDIFLDYSNWKLSGIWTNQNSVSGSDSGFERPLQDFQKGNQPGQVASIGALEMQDSLKQNSVFSKRNFFVNGLVLIGTTAGGFAFLGPTGFTQAVAGYSGSFLPALQKFWPDRRIDQQSNLLKYGFQDKMVIAKEDPGKTYAFFPIERVLTKGLAKIYRENPALFLNLAELYLDPNAGSIKEYKYLRYELDSMILQFIPAGSLACQASAAGCVRQGELAARIFSDLFSPCYYGPKTTDNPLGEEDCTLSASSIQPSTKLLEPGLREIRAVKDIVQGLSLNKVQVVVSGIMTVDVDLIPAVLTKIDFDDAGAGQKPIWEDPSTKHAGVIHGNYLTNGRPTISGIKVPSEPNGKLGDYIDPTSMAAVSDNSTDSELHFVVQFKKAIPNNATLTFQVAKSSNKSTNAQGTANTQVTTTSMGLDYPVSYTPSTPVIDKVVFDSPADLLKKGDVKGHLQGSNLDSATVTIKSVTKADGTSAKPETYFTDPSPAISTTSNSKQIDFTLSVKDGGLPGGATMVFEVTRKSADGSSHTAEAKSDPVPAK
jgi:hypothetical protein